MLFLFLLVYMKRSMYKKITNFFIIALFAIMCAYSPVSVSAQSSNGLSEEQRQEQIQILIKLIADLQRQINEILIERQQNANSQSDEEVRGIEDALRIVRVVKLGEREIAMYPKVLREVDTQSNVSFMVNGRQAFSLSWEELKRLSRFDDFKSIGIATAGIDRSGTYTMTAQVNGQTVSQRSFYYEYKEQDGSGSGTVTEPQCPIVFPARCGVNEELKSNRNAQGCITYQCVPTAKGDREDVVEVSKVIKYGEGTIAIYSETNFASNAKYDLNQTVTFFAKRYTDGGRATLGPESLPKVLRTTTLGKVSDLASANSKFVVDANKLRLGGTYEYYAYVGGKTMKPYRFTYNEGKTQCPIYNRPICKAGQTLVIEKDRNGCSIPKCVADFKDPLLIDSVEDKGEFIESEVKFRVEPETTFDESRKYVYYVRPYSERATLGPCSINPIARGCGATSVATKTLGSLARRGTVTFSEANANIKTSGSYELLIANDGKVVDRKKFFAEVGSEKPRGISVTNLKIDNNNNLSAVVGFEQGNDSALSRDAVVYIEPRDGFGGLRGVKPGAIKIGSVSSGKKQTIRTNLDKLKGLKSGNSYRVHAIAFHSTDRHAIASSGYFTYRSNSGNVSGGVSIESVRDKGSFIETKVSLNLRDKYSGSQNFDFYVRKKTSGPVTLGPCSINPIVQGCGATKVASRTLANLSIRNTVTFSERSANIGTGSNGTYELLLATNGKVVDSQQFVTNISPSTTQKASIYQSVANLVEMIIKL